MISAPAIGCASASVRRSASAGGQLEQPSDVNSSTNTGVGFDAVTAEPCGARPSARAHARAPNDRMCRIVSLYRSFPEYDWLNDLLQSGKSGTMLSTRARDNAGQLKNDGSTIFTRCNRPSPSNITACTMRPRHPSTMPNAGWYGSNRSPMTADSEPGGRVEQT